MKTMNMKSVCRICAYKVEDENFVHLFEHNQAHILRKIQDLTGLKLKPEHNLPNCMCSQCLQDLEEAIIFRTKCISSQNYFVMTKAKQTQRKPNAAKTHEIETKAAGNNCKAAATPESFMTIFIMGSDETQPGAELLPKTVYAIAPNDSADELPNDYDSCNEPLIEDCCEENSSNANEMTERLLDKHHNKSNVEVNGQTPDVSLEEIAIKKTVVNIANKNSSKSKVLNEETTILPSARTGVPKQFMCDQCGNHFTSRNYFNMHLRRHTGDKQFCCEICNTKFFTQTELNRHMRRHTGDRPFACRHCDRRFTDYSTRIKHERTHTNERPFACDQCGKAFTTSYILKNHILIHTGERSFSCKLCNKFFQRSSHLSVHYRSLMHRQNEQKAKDTKSNLQQIKE